MERGEQILAMLHAAAGLVTEGLTNKQIAQQLFISDNTVDSHIRHIMNKLGVNSRSQIASWVSSRSSQE